MEVTSLSVERTVGLLDQNRIWQVTSARSYY